MRLFWHIALVAIGSAVGGLMRWGVHQAALRWLGLSFPWGTLFINLSGSFFLGWLVTFLTERVLADPARLEAAEDLRLLFAVGFAGAYTTFSTFELETQALLRDGSGLLGATYVAASVFVGLLAVRWGMAVGQW